MTDEAIRQIITAEFEAPTLGATEQYLEIHSPIYKSGGIEITRIDREQIPDRIIAYLPVTDQHFFFAVYIDPATEKIFNIGTEARNIVRLYVTSETLSVDELKALTALQPTENWNKGDLKKDKKSTHKYSFIGFEPNPEPDGCEDKLTKLLEYLSGDKEQIRALTTHPDVEAHVNVIMDFHHGNQLLGWTWLDASLIHRLSEFNLSVGLDTNAWGTPFK